MGPENINNTSLKYGETFYGSMTFSLAVVKETVIES